MHVLTGEKHTEPTVLRPSSPTFSRGDYGTRQRRDPLSSKITDKDVPFPSVYTIQRRLPATGTAKEKSASVQLDHLNGGEEHSVDDLRCRNPFFKSRWRWIIKRFAARNWVAGSVILPPEFLAVNLDSIQQTFPSFLAESCFWPTQCNFLVGPESLFSVAVAPKFRPVHHLTSSLNFTRRCIRELFLYSPNKKKRNR